MYDATTLFVNGELFSDDRKEVAAAILEADALANSGEHESKLIRIEIGMAIRRVASADEVTLTETISNLNLCQTYDRSEKTFLKYARVAGDPRLRLIANDPGVSFSVLDEIASSKKPNDPIKRREFMDRVVKEVNDRNAQIREEEGLGATITDKLRAPGISRAGVIGAIRRNQVEFGVPTRAVTPAGNPKERDVIKHRKMLARTSRLLRLVNIAQIMLMPDEVQDQWLEREGLTWMDIAKSFASTRSRLVNDGIIKANKIDLVAANLIPGVHMLRDEDAAAEGKDIDNQEETTNEQTD